MGQLEVVYTIEYRRLICWSCKAMRWQDTRDTSDVYCRCCACADKMGELKEIVK